MNIPQQLPQFNQERACLCVVGAKFGSIYFLSNGLLLPLGDVEDELPPYEGSKDGYFQRGGSGKELGTWAVQKDDSIEVERRFIQNVTDELKTYVTALKPAAVYVFSPDYITDRLLQALETIQTVTFVPVGNGNYTKKQPLELLEMIDRKYTEDIDPSNPDSVDRNDPHADEKIKLLSKARI